ncbi:MULTISPECIES: IclR family transcriptional regulator domain-containing protein [Thermus]|jgi:DNA-binding IclR family transcriptional regulator|uniref:IclR family transcriptional regulator n=1 Tax=Thermus brockianus TaxID=56956 RepID=A0A1J0LWD2_THEBO|nr:IclR family transcriptional regulator C-terminal domain-containing protein [Thermus brockianus]APD10442.1 IclR family transcriptional regulator [Thermus brockianus]BDG17716.1 IclR family transcriptional regulator [Thermus brockianus]
MPRSSFHLPLRALKALYAHPLGLRPTELAKSLSVSPRSLAKALEALRVEGFAARDPLTGRWVLRYPHPFIPIPEAPDDPFFYQELAHEAFSRTGLRAYVLTVRPWGLHVEATSGNRGQRLWPFRDERRPVTGHAHASAGGKAILAFLREEALRAHLQRFPPKPLTPRTLSTVAAVQADLGQVRQLGFARARGEAIPDRCGLAVPLRAATGEAFAALGLSLPMGDPCVFEAPEAPKACRACRALAPALKEVVAELWPSSAA